MVGQRLNCQCKKCLNLDVIFQRTDFTMFGSGIKHLCMSACFYPIGTTRLVSNNDNIIHGFTNSIHKLNDYFHSITFQTKTKIEIAYKIYNSENDYDLMLYQISNGEVMLISQQSGITNENLEEVIDQELDELEEMYEREQREQREHHESQT